MKLQSSIRPLSDTVVRFKISLVPNMWKKRRYVYVHVYFYTYTFTGFTSAALFSIGQKKKTKCSISFSDAFYDAGNLSGTRLICVFKSFHWPSVGFPSNRSVRGLAQTALITLMDFPPSLTTTAIVFSYLSGHPLAITHPYFNAAGVCMLALCLHGFPLDGSTYNPKMCKA